MPGVEMPHSLGSRHPSADRQVRHASLPAREDSGRISGNVVTTECVGQVEGMQVRVRRAGQGFYALITDNMPGLEAADHDLKTKVRWKS